MPAAESTCTGVPWMPWLPSAPMHLQRAHAGRSRCLLPGAGLPLPISAKHQAIGSTAGLRCSELATHSPHHLPPAVQCAPSAGLPRSSSRIRGTPHAACATLASQTLAWCPSKLSWVLPQHLGNQHHMTPVGRPWVLGWSGRWWPADVAAAARATLYCSLLLLSIVFTAPTAARPPSPPFCKRYYTTLHSATLGFQSPPPHYILRE